ncbi:MAG: alpha-hydroxy-acid oxidizing protein [Flavobacteriaceae bacterium]
MNKDIHFMDYRCPSVNELRERSKKKVPKFAFEYLDGGCHDDVNLKRNTQRIRDIELKPKYLIEQNDKALSLRAKIFGHTYSLPFGIAPIGLQGLMWPKATEILAKASFDHNIPFILSTVSTASIEKISEITEGKAWFQLYHPSDKKITKDLLERADKSGVKTLVILADVPSFGYRPRDIKNGLSMPPKMTLSNFFQILKRPEWAIKTLINGQPNFEVLKPYMPKNLNLSQLGKFMDETFSGRLNEEKIKYLRDLWKGNLVIKGTESLYDVEKAYQLGLNGIIISNHGGRQVDVGQATIDSLKSIAPIYNNKIEIMMDSGIRGGADIARVLAHGANFTFLGRSFMYGVSALGTKGGNHTITMLKKQLTQVMEQLSCKQIYDLKNTIV